MKQFARLLMIVAGMFTLACSVRSEAKPNVLFIMIDDLRPQLGCYGYAETISPNIDKPVDSYARSVQCIASPSSHGVEV